MGMFSWKCPHCDRGILESGSTDTGINEWMNKTVVLLENGSIIKGSYDGYGGVGGMKVSDFMYGKTVMAHDACWRVAGKPDLEEYEEGSQHDPDQGWGNESEFYNMKEPGAEIDEARWQAALRLKAERKRRRLVERSIKILRPELGYEEREVSPEEHYTLRYEVGHIEPFEPTEHRPKDWMENRVVGWYFYDKLDYDREVEGIATEEEARALAKKLFDEWAASEEAEAIKAEWRSWQESAQVRYEARMRKEGRFEADRYRPHTKVEDRCTYKTVQECGSKEEAAEVAARLNSEWEAQGFPMPEKDLDDWDTLFSAIACETDYTDAEGIDLLKEQN